MSKKQTKNNKSKGKFNMFSWFKNSLQFQILIPFIILIMVTGGVIAYVSYESSINITTDELTDSVEGQMVSMNDTFEIYFSNMHHTLERFEANESFKDPVKNEDIIIQLFKETQEVTPTIEGLYTGLATGEMFLYQTDDLPSDYVVADRVWYQDAVESNGEIIWTEPYPNANTNEMVVTVAKAYFDGDTLIGVLGADVQATTLVDIVDNIEIGETGYAIIYDGNGQLVAHPDESMIGDDQSDQAYYKQMSKESESGIIEFESGGEETIIGYANNPSTGWTIGGIVNKEDFVEKARAIIAPILITLGIVVLIAIAISLITTRRITRAIRMVMERMQQIADGDLSHEPLVAQSRDEVGQLVNATNDMNENMRNVLQEINRVSEVVSSQSE